MSKKIILGFIGDLAAGKGTICKYLQDKYQMPNYRYSTMLRDVLKRLYIEPSRDNLQKISSVLRENFGQELLSRVIAEDVVNDKHDLVAVEGIRRPMDILFLEKNPDFHLIYITADAKLRWQRLVARNENKGDDKKTFEDFSRDEQNEADRLIKTLGQTARYTITNNGSFEEFYAQLEKILTQIKNAS